MITCVYVFWKYLTSKFKASVYLPIH
jgi:hypothetical protein